MICFACGKCLTTEGVQRVIDGNPIRLHATCAKTFDNLSPKPFVPKLDGLTEPARDPDTIPLRQPGNDNPNRIEAGKPRAVR